MWRTPRYNTTKYTESVRFININVIGPFQEALYCNMVNFSWSMTLFGLEMLNHYVAKHNTEINSLSLLNIRLPNVQNITSNTYTTNNDVSDTYLEDTVLLKFKILIFSAHRHLQPTPIDAGIPGSSIYHPHSSADITRRLQKASVIAYFTFRATIIMASDSKSSSEGDLSFSSGTGNADQPWNLWAGNDWPPLPPLNEPGEKFQDSETTM